MGRSTTGIPEDRPESALSASDEARLERISDRQDRARKINDRIWYGEGPKKTPAQAELVLSYDLTPPLVEVFDPVVTDDGDVFTTTDGDSLYWLGGT
jgi:hypothetical protein